MAHVRPSSASLAAQIGFDPRRLPAPSRRPAAQALERQTNLSLGADWVLEVGFEGNVRARVALRDCLAQRVRVLAFVGERDRERARGQVDDESKRAQFSFSNSLLA
jgi:hypothetical protein